MTLKLIKTEADYADALSRIDELFDAKPDTPEGDELDLLVTLVELYEKREFPIDLPDPIDAIRFRMEQQGLRAKDLIPYIGSASKVSEVLSGKRPLSIGMIRKVHEGLRIPAEVLLREPGAVLPSSEIVERIGSGPFREMLKRGWFEGFSGSLSDAMGQMEELLMRFVGFRDLAVAIPAFHRQRIGEGETRNEAMLIAWKLRVMNLAERESLPPWKNGTVTPEFLNEVAHLSYLDSGPVLAREFLNKNGIHLVFEAHLPKTRLDGAAIKMSDGSPLIALTLRFDRLDWFWFTLFHELAHVALHLYSDECDAFFDELSEAGKDDLEKEADDYASKTLIPEDLWNTAGLSRHSPAEAFIEFSKRLRISTSIPAGRVRYETGDYSIFTALVGNGKLRRLFT